MCSAHSHQLPDRSLARVRALFGKVDILCADGNVRSLGARNHSGQQNRRGKQRNLIPRVTGNKRQKSFPTNAFASAGVLYIFQLAAISFFRGSPAPVAVPEDKSGLALARIACILIVTTDGGGRRRSHRFGDAMSHDKIRDAARRRMTRTGESYATARRRVLAEREAEDAKVPDAVRLGDPALSANEVRAAAAAHDELGPEYSDAAVASFLEKVEEEIAARVDARLAAAGGPETSADRTVDARC